MKGRGAAMAWFLALFWNAISITGCYAGFVQGDQEPFPLGLAAIPFQAVGFWLLWRAFKMSWQQRRFGPARLDLAREPVAPGEWLEGVVSFGSPPQSPEGFRVKLACLRAVRSGAGADSRLEEVVDWESEYLTQDEVRVPDGPWGIPVRFEIPGSAPSTVVKGDEGRIRWQLEVEADVPGIDCHASFDVPIGTGQEVQTHFAMPPASRSRTVSKSGCLPTHPERLERQGITVESRPSAAFMVSCQAGRPRHYLLSTLAVLLGWTCFLAIVVSIKDPILIAGFGFFEYLIFRWAMVLWFRSVSVEADARGLVITWTWFGARRTLRVDKADLRGVSVRQGGQAFGRRYHDIQVDRKSTRTTLVAVPSIEGRDSAKWLADQLTRALAS
ncbi:MAG: hypothetical protein AB7F75_05595 [Planctomycetota bacterium]